MDIKDAQLTKQGKPIAGDPEPGKYYRVEVKPGTDIKAAALAFKKRFPKSFFMFRAAGPSAEATASDVPPAKKPEAQPKN